MFSIEDRVVNISRLMGRMVCVSLANTQLCCCCMGAAIDNACRHGRGWVWPAARRSWQPLLFSVPYPGLESTGFIENCLSEFIKV